MKLNNVCGIVAVFFLRLAGIFAAPSLLRRRTAEGWRFPPSPFHSNSTVVFPRQDALEREHLATATASEAKAEAVHLAGKGNSSGSVAPRVFLLFLVNDAIGSAEHWRSFFDGTSSASWRALAHCKNPWACKSSPSFKILPEVTIVETVGSWYCHDLVSAMVQLLRVATAEAGHPSDKFAFMSDSTLPVKPPHEVHSALMAHGESDICVFPSNHWGHAKVDETKEAILVKHHQWVVLNREHAERMVKEWVPVQADGHWNVPLQRGTPYETRKPYSAEWFKRAPNANCCTDEWAIYATLFGAVVSDAHLGPVSVPGLSGSPLYLNGHQMQGTCRTFAFFRGDGPAFRDLGQALGHDSSNRVSCWPWCTARPMSFMSLSDEGVLAMRNSPFLFARKFVPGSVTPKSFQKIILAATPPTLPLPTEPPPPTAPPPATQKPKVRAAAHAPTPKPKVKPSTSWTDWWAGWVSPTK